MLVSAIVAVAKNNVIGKDGRLPWYLPADLAYFKRITLNHCVIMGRGTLESLGRPLPKRTNIVITRDPYYAVAGALVAHSIEEALGIAFDEGEVEVFILGGGQIFEDTQELWDRLYITDVNADPEGDTFFPTLDSGEWEEVWREEHEADGKNEYAYTFRVLERIKLEDDL